jgi:two-component system, chemotaxis family, chemotaxis protein CheY
MKLNSIRTPRFSNLTIPTVQKRVLVLDDDADMLSVYASTLARAGYTADAAGDGEHGWEALCAVEYDLLLTDNDMPRLTGVELIARLRRAGMTLPVIIATGSIVLPEGGDGERLGLASVLHKPFTPDELVGAVQQVVPLQWVAPAFIHHLGTPASELMSANQRRFAGLNE